MAPVGLGLLLLLTAWGADSEEPKTPDKPCPTCDLKVVPPATITLTPSKPARPKADDGPLDPRLFDLTPVVAPTDPPPTTEPLHSTSRNLADLPTPPPRYAPILQPPVPEPPSIPAPQPPDRIAPTIVDDPLPNPVPGPSPIPIAGGYLDPLAAPIEVDRAVDGPTTLIENIEIKTPAVLLPVMLGDGLFQLYRRGPGRSRAHVNPRFPASNHQSPTPQSRLYSSGRANVGVIDSQDSVHVGEAGFEWADVDNLWSIGLATSFWTGTGRALSSDADAGPLLATLKGVVYQNQTWVWSMGTSVQIHAWDVPATLPRDQHYVNPFVGFSGVDETATWFVQGFEQLSIPIGSDDQALSQFSVGIGRLIGSRDCCSGWRWAPIVELNLANPIGQAPTGMRASLQTVDVVNLGAGLAWKLSSRAAVTPAIHFPLSSDRFADLQAQVQLNWSF